MLNDLKPYTGPKPNHIVALLEHAEALNKAGYVVYFGWLCKCGNPNRFHFRDTLFVKGRCEKCDHVTDLFEESANVGLVADTVTASQLGQN